VSHEIEAVAFDCYGTLIDFGDESFARAYGQICAEQGIPLDGHVFYDKWMEVWRRLAREGHAADGGSIGVVTAGLENEPGPLSEAEVVPPHPEHHTPSAGRSRSLDGPLPPFRPYREEWPEHFAICFEELGVTGDPFVAHNRLVELIVDGPAFPEAHRAVQAVRARLPVALLSNADDDFLLPCLRRNGLNFPITVSSETAQAYKPHAAIFRTLADALSLPPAKILYVGDSRLADIAGAKNAGLRAAWINRKPDATANRSIEVNSGDVGKVTFEPDYEIDSLDRLVEVLGLR
jgi:2-haloalkanoic acid dehalogenase type II